MCHHYNKKNTEESYGHLDKCRKSIWYNSSPIHYRTFRKLRIGYQIKSMYIKPKKTTTFNGGILKGFLLRLVTSWQVDTAQYSWAPPLDTSTSLIPQNTMHHSVFFLITKESAFIYYYVRSAGYRSVYTERIQMLKMLRKEDKFTKMLISSVSGW